jgi:hypothetical protein
MPHSSKLHLLALHGLRLKGFAEAAAVAQLIDRPEAEVSAGLEPLAREGFVVHRQGRLTGWTLTPEGRSENERLLAEELDRIGAREVAKDCYERFLALNDDMLATCTRWQVRDVDGEQVLNDHSDPAYDEQVVADLGSIDERVRPICAELTEHLERFGHYAPRFTAALTKVRDGEPEWFTKPIIESYHTVWFELHEDLLATLGIDRASEGADR